jgi:hypothetical protein
MTTELKLRDAPGIALTDAILTVLRLIVAESDPRLRATLAQTLDAMSHSYGGKGATLRFETGSQALCWAAQRSYSATSTTPHILTGGTIRAPSSVLMRSRVSLFAWSKSHRRDTRDEYTRHALAVRAERVSQGGRCAAAKLLSDRPYGLGGASYKGRGRMLAHDMNTPMTTPQR